MDLWEQSLSLLREQLFSQKRDHFRKGYLRENASLSIPLAGLFEGGERERLRRDRAVVPASGEK